MNNHESSMNLLSTYLETKNHDDLLKFRQNYADAIPTWHVSMLNDVPRNKFYRDEINLKVKDKIVMDLGCGNGLLTYFALLAGAKHVYAIEKDPILQTCFAHAFKKEMAEGRVSLFKDLSIHMEKKDFTAGPPEVVIHEIFSNDLFSEKIMESFEDLYKREMVHSKMEFIPQKFRLMGKLHIAQENSNLDVLNDSGIREKFWFLESIISSAESLRYLPFGSKLGNDVSDEFEIFTFNMNDFKPAHSKRQSIKSNSDGNYVRTWFELTGENSKLTTDIRSASETHWENPLYRTTFQKGSVNLKSTYQNQHFSVIVETNDQSN